MKLPSVPGVVSGVRDRWQARGSSAASEPSRPARSDAGVPMPLALQGVVELLVVAVVGLLLGALLLGAVWAAGGFATLGAAGSLRLAGQAWLLSHGAPVGIHAIQGLSLDGGGTVTLLPLGLSLIPFALAVVAGRRIARACWRGQFLVPFVAGMAAYAGFGVLVALLSRTEQVSVQLLPAALCPLVPAGLGTLVGGWSVSRSLAAVLGTDAASWLERTSQYSRWAGSYVWAVIRAGFLAAVAAVAGGALLLTLALGANWDDVITVYQDLGTGAAGDTALTALQLGLLPNMVVWALAWSTGAGFSLGSGTITSPFQTVLGPLPQFPALAAVPADPGAFAAGVLALPVIAGLLAGWWFCREGENHLDDWMAIRLPLRWLTFVLSTLLTVAFIAAVGAGLVAALAWLSGGSLGIGRLTEIGPDAGKVFVWLGAELAVGAAVGYLLGPWLEREGYRSRSWGSDDDGAAALSDGPVPAAQTPSQKILTGDHDKAEEEEPPVAPRARRFPWTRSSTPEDTMPEHPAPEDVRSEHPTSEGEPVEDPVRPGETPGPWGRSAAASASRTGSTTVGARDTARAPRTKPATVRVGGAEPAPVEETDTGPSRRKEAKRRRAEKRSAKRKAARLAAMDRENER
ncbi:DUF6350 family protein [Kocuria rhizophila]|uniref:cell division protein PerM n=1 Tax=Kocuria rhizophila TaxID=72000 RepID=UPI001F1BD038|nr:DUF6350 family protein [Kocuria rhizophila]